MHEIYRILDANFNRAREGLRVLEDCARFMLNSKPLSQEAKTLRSKLQQLLAEFPEGALLASRDTPGDTGTTNSSATEYNRSSLREIISAGAKRTTESLRTIEEYSKLVSPAQAKLAEQLRYKCYTLEQKITAKVCISDQFKQANIYALISSDMIECDMEKLAREILSAGVDIIQLREKNSCDRDFYKLAKMLRTITSELGKIFIINDRVDIAALVGADGLHLGQDDLPLEAARKLCRPGTVIGRSCHCIEHVNRALDEGADYIALGPMFETKTKNKVPVSPALLEEFCAEFGTDPSNRPPVVTIGGINADNVDILISKGASCVAVCGAIIKSANPANAVAEIKKVFAKLTPKK